jgi:hypothetical protein
MTQLPVNFSILFITIKKRRKKRKKEKGKERNYGRETREESDSY